MNFVWCCYKHFFHIMHPEYCIKMKVFCGPVWHLPALYYQDKIGEKEFIYEDTCVRCLEGGEKEEAYYGPRMNCVVERGIIRIRPSDITIATNTWLMEAKLLVLIVTSSRLFRSIPTARTVFRYVRNMYSIGREDSQHPRLKDFPFSSKRCRLPFLYIGSFVLWNSEKRGEEILFFLPKGLPSALSFLSSLFQMPCRHFRDSWREKGKYLYERKILTRFSLPHPES